MLKDGEWHMLDEVREKAQLDENQLEQITAFLREYEFIILNETKEQLKIQEAVRKFIT